MNYYLAIDIGASSGRHILGHLENGKIILEEIYRFHNGFINVDGQKCWDIEALYESVIAGLMRCKDLDKIPHTVGIDTWAVDFVLLDSQDKLIGNAVAYRDGRTKGMDEEVYKIIPQTELYARTGIQKQIFNTIYQLMALKKNVPEYLTQAESLLMIPEYLNFLLTGKKASEYTNATTTQLVSPVTKDWDYELIELLGFPKKIFGNLKTPGSVVAGFSDEVKKLVGFNSTVVLPATHDTASAVIAVPSVEKNPLYISSGTWSLMGTEIISADCSEESEKRNFTNEGGIDYRFRYLKNIMGMWMINEARREIAPDMSFSEISERAARSSIESIVPANDNRFLAPESMVKEIQSACKETNQQIPEGIDDIAAVIYNSLANCYADTLGEIEEMTGKVYRCINIVGGGSNADYLNKLTAKACGRTVYAGPTEGTAIGNIAVQLIAAGEIDDLSEAREIIFNSFPIKKYEIEEEC